MDQILVTMNATSEISSSLQDAILRTCHAESFVQLDRRILNDVFPHPERLSMQEVDEMITLAIVGNIPPPPEEPTQAEKIATFCEKYRLILRDNGWEPFVTFLAKGMPDLLKDLTKQKMEDCAIGEFVHESNMPAHVRGSHYAQCRPKQEAPRFQSGDTMRREIAITPMTFKRERLHNEEAIYKRIS